MTCNIKLFLFLILLISENCFSQNCGIDSSLCYSYQQYPGVTFGAQQSLQSVQNTVVFQTPLVVDVNQDCVPEIIVAGITGYSDFPRVTSGITILNSVTGATISSFPTVFYSWSCPLSYVIGDINLDGLPEIIVAAANYTGNAVNLKRKLVCYDFLGNVLWVSDQNYGNNTSMQFEGTPSLADFNQDGIPEVYIHNQIFNAQTGISLADGGSNGIGRMVMVSPYYEICLTIAGDLDSNPNDLELAAGYTVYDVQITNTNGTVGNSMTPINIMIDGLNRDGMTSLTDINLDGKLDIIVGTEGTETSSRLYAYYLNNINVPVLIAKTPMPRGTTAPYSTFTGAPFVGDLDGNGIPSICVTRNFRLVAYSYNGTTTFQQKWVVNTIDQSGCTGITSFDFDQNGIQELVFRDEQNMKIINGNGSTPTTLSVIPCSSPTVNDMAIVADIDNTGTSKICVTCGTNNTAKLKVYSSNGTIPWAPSRKIWNQYAYHVFNINDDATVPQFQLNNASIIGGERNNFYVQATLLDANGNSMIPASDVSGNILCITNNQITNEININFEISNDSLASQSVLSGLNISFFNGNPETSGTLIGTTVYNTQINPGNTYSTNFQIPFSSSSTGNTIYMVVNNNGLTTGSNFQPQNFGQIECNYLNNIDSFNIISIDAGIDQQNCGIQSFVLNASNSSGFFGNWEIISGSGNLINLNDPNTTYTPNTTGASTLHWVIEDSICQFGIDDIVVNSNPIPIVNPAPDLSICIGDSIQIGLTNPNLYSYQWTSNFSSSVSNLQLPFVTPNQATTYYLEITDPSTNCINFDTLIVSTLIQPSIIPLSDFTICFGDSVNVSYLYNADYSYNWMPLNTTGSDFNELVDSTSLFIVTITNNLNGCYVIDSFTINVNGVSSINPTPLEICQGDSSQIQFQSIANTIFSISYDSVNYSNIVSGIYISPPNSGYYLIESVDTILNCVNLDTLFFTINPLPNVNAGTDKIICEGDNTILTGSGALNYGWDNGQMDNVLFSPNATNTYTVLGTDIYGCIGTDQVTITVNPLPLINAGPDQEICLGESITLWANGSTSFSWNNGVIDGQSFTPTSSQTYTVTSTDINGCTNNDQIVLTVNPLPNVSANVDQSICIGSTLTLTGSGAFSYSWNNNVTNGVSFTPLILGTTNYTVIGTSQVGCVNSHDVLITVLPLPIVFAGLDTTICNGESITLSAMSAQSSSFIWNDNLPNPSLIQPNLGFNTYYVQVIDSDGCIGYDSVVVNVLENPIANFQFTPHEIIESNTSLNFINLSLGSTFSTWIFNNLDTTSVFSPEYTVVSPSNTGLMVTLIVTNEIGCIDSMTITIPFNESPYVYIPNSFTPNGNEFNNTFFVVSSGSISEIGFEFLIFDRWGEIIFESHNLYMGWDGTYNGQIVQDGTYTWKLKYRDQNSDKVYEGNGHVNVIK